MRRILLAFVLVLLAAAGARAQFTTVSATITDPQGLRYSNGTVSIQLTTPGGTSPMLNGVGFTTSFGPLALDATGSFTARLADNNVVLPTGTRWTFTVCPQGGSPCATTGPILISGTTQSITGPINAIVAPQLSGFPTPFPTAGLSSSTLNVKDPRFGATGNTQHVIDAATTNGTATVTSATANFLASDSGKTGYVIRRDQTGSQVLAPSSVTFVNSTTVTMGASANFTCAANCLFTWGTPDDAALIAVGTAAQVDGVLFGKKTKNPGIIYAPAGGYMISQRVFNLLGATGSELGPSVIGDGSAFTYFYVRPDTTFPAASAPLFLMGGSLNTFQGFSIFGSGFLFNTGSPMIRFRCNSCTVRDVNVQQLASSGFGQNLLEVTGNKVKLFFVAAFIDGTVNAGDVTACDVGPNASDIDWYSPFCSNLNRNLLVTTITGGGSGQRVSVYGGDIDECGSAASCTDIVAASDVYISTTGINANNSLTQFAMTVDGTSTVRLNQANLGCFSAGFTCTNANPLRILIGGTVISTGSEFRGGSTGGVALTNNGTFIDAGGNTFTGANLLSGNVPKVGGTMDTVANLTPAAPGAVPGCSADVTVTMTGAVFTDKVSWSSPATAVAGQIGQAFVSAANTVTLRWCQFSGAAAAPPSGNYRFKLGL